MKRITNILLVGLTLLASLNFVATTSGEEKAKADLRIGELRVNKILFLGNSITLHGPAPSIGWDGNWGMAATAREKDFVHLLLSQLTKAAGGKPEVKIKNIADLERGLDTFDIPVGLKEELAFEADVVVLAIGENVAALSTEELKTKFKTTLTNLLAELKKQGHPVIFVRSTFWADLAKDEILKKTCLDAGGIFVDNSKLSSDEGNFARSERKIEHAGVAGHPGDKGMKAIADALWTAFQDRAAKPSAKLDRPGRVSSPESNGLPSVYYWFGIGSVFRGRNNHGSWYRWTAERRQEHPFQRPDAVEAGTKCQLSFLHDRAERRDRPRAGRSPRAD